MDIRVAYSGLLYFSGQLSCINYFHLNYRLKDIEFPSLNHFKLISEFLLLLNPTLSTTVLLTGQT